MINHNFNRPLVIKTKQNDIAFFKEGKNKLIWQNHIKTSIEVSYIEKKVDRILAKSNNGSVYTIISKKSKFSEKGFVLRSNFDTIAETWSCLVAGIGELTWISYRGICSLEEIPEENSKIRVINSLGDKNRIISEVNSEERLPGFRPPQVGAI